MSLYDVHRTDHDSDAQTSTPAGPVVRVFGSVGVEDVDGPISIGGPRQRRLLALMALRAGTVVDIDWLAEYLWDDDDRPESTAPTLRTYVSRLRAAFPEAVRDWIATEPDGYRLAAPPDAVEHVRFTRLRAAAAEAREREDPQTAQRLLSQALGLWRGEPFRELADLELAQAEIERLRLDRLDMMEERWEAALALGRHTQITGELAAFAAEHGERDRAVRQYALALHRSGRTTEALEVVREHRRVLVEEFGLDPSAEIAELERALLDDDPTLIAEKDGRRLRGYRLLEEIGAGSFAVVWRGVQPSVGREVAVKQIRRELATQPAFIRRFEAEAHLVARIEHPHIVPLIDYWRDPDSAYLVMRWLRGGTLERRLDEGPLPLAATLAMARQIGGALSAAHAHGVIHRDVKTANILFDTSGNAFLTDFGIALEAAESSGPEAALSPGSPAYSSPEQIRGEQLTPAADVFSLGVVLYECLAGGLPFGESPSADELLEKQLHEPYPALSELRSDIPTALSDAITRATAKDPADRFASMNAFVTALDAAAGADVRADVESAEPLGELENPYVGLLAFDDASADRFYGRERLVSEMVQRLSGDGVGSRSIVIVGPSGSGKSSVARAGLLPALRNGAVPGSADWFITTMTPGDDPFESLEAALLRVAVNPPSSLLDQLHDGRRGVLRSVRRCLPSESQRLIVLIDQFEELFVGRSSPDAEAFLDALAVAVGEPSTPLRLVMTLRADYYGHPLEHPTFAAILDSATVNVTPLAGDELELAIVEPARALGVRYESGLVARIAADANGQPSPLPLLQYTLAELFERRDERTLTADAYDDIGGLAGALSARAEALYRQADPQQRDAIRRVFGRLTDPGGSTADLRRRARVVDLGDDDTTAWVLDRYGAARLITFDRDPVSREPTVEVAHEALLREWPRLVEWLEADRELLRAADALWAAAEAWDEGGRTADDLLRGGRLDRATELTETAPLLIRPLDREYLDTSLSAQAAAQAAERRNQRRLRLLAGGVGAVAVLAVAAIAMAALQLVRADEEARTAAAAQERNDVTSLIRASSEADPTTGILLALEASRRDPGAETDRALLAALARASGGRTVGRFEAPPTDACSATWPGWVARSGMLMTAAVDGMAVSRDLDSGDTTEHFLMPDGSCGRWFGDPASDRRYAVSAEGDRLWLGPFEGDWERDVRLDGRSWVSGADGLAGNRLLLESPGGVTLVDAEAGTPVGVPLFHLDADPVAALADDGSSLAVATPAEASSDRAGTILVLDAADGSERSQTAVPDAVTALAFRPDSDRLLAGTADGRVLQLDLTAGGRVESVQDVAGASIDHIQANAAGEVLLVVDETPATLLLMGPEGQVQASASVDGLEGAALRAEGLLTTWDTSGRIEVLEPEVEPLLAASIDLSSAGEIARDDWVGIDDGRALVVHTDDPRGHLTDLATGAQGFIELSTPDGERILRTTEMWAFEGGHAAVSFDADVALWKDGVMVDHRAIVDEAEVSVEGSAQMGSRVLVGVRRGLVGGSLRLVLLELGGDEIVEVLSMDLPTILTAIPRHDGGMIVVGPDDIVRTYDDAGSVIDEDQLAFDAASGDITWAFDGRDRVAAARPTTVGARRVIEYLDVRDDATATFQTEVDVANLGFARDGELLVLQGRDGSVRSLDVGSGVVSPVIWAGDGAPFSVPWYDAATDSVWVASTRQLAQLPLGREAWRERACQRVGRDLTADEWAEYVPGEAPRVPMCAASAA